MRCDELGLVDGIGDARDDDRLAPCATCRPLSTWPADGWRPTRCGRSPCSSSGEFRIWPPVGKSGPLTQRHNCTLVSSSLSRSLSSAVQISPRLCGGMLVAMPTAMPVAPLTSRFGMRAGQDDRLGLRAVEVRPHRDGVLIELDEQLSARRASRLRCSDTPRRHRRRAIRSFPSRRRADSAARRAAPFAPAAS